MTVWPWPALLTTAGRTGLGPLPEQRYKGSVLPCLVAALLLTLAASCTGPQAAPTPTAAPTGAPPTLAPTATATQVPEGEHGLVVRVIDGDTIDVEIDGRVRRVRYIGIDSPERERPGYREATAANARLVEGQRVRLEKDVSETDDYGRLLRYVYVDALLVNEELIVQGWARAVTIPPDTRFARRFIELERRARQAGVGLWAR